MQKLGILCSGGLGLDILSKISKEYDVEFVLTDSNSIEIINFVKSKNILFFAGNPRHGIGYNFIHDINVDIILSVNYLFLIEDDIISHANIFTFNIHGSLLPKYRGRTPHVWAIINGETKTGITAHVIDKGCDTGQIIRQIEIPIEPDDTGATILKKYAKAYFPLIKKVLKDVEKGQLCLISQNNKEASYYGKRTPADGEINWNWPSERIRNWIRAQALPYPGAFTFYEEQKIIIDKVSLYDNNDMFKDQGRGTILSIVPNIIIKTIDGVLKIDKMRTENCTFEIGKKFENENRK